MSRNGPGRTEPSRMTRTTPVFWTTNNRWLSSRGDATYTGWSKAPTGTSVGAAAAGAARASASSSARLVVRHMPVLRLERQLGPVPGLEAARHRVRLPPGAAERGGRHRRARADAAVEHDGAVALDGVGLGGEAPELEVPGAGDPAGRVLVVLP